MSSSLIWGRHLIAQAGAAGDTTVVPHGALYQENGQILDVGPVDELRARHTPDEEIGSSHHIVLPGLINGHHHFGVTLLQQGILDQPLEPRGPARWGIRRIDPYLDTLYGAAKMIEAGVTTVMHNDGGVIRAPNGAVSDQRSHQILKAYDDSGMRVAYSVTVRDQYVAVYQEDDQFLASLPTSAANALRPKLDAMKLPHDAYFELFDSLVDTYNQRERARILHSPHNVHWCSDTLLQRIKQSAQEHGVGIHTHVSETPYQKLFAQRLWTKTPVEHLNDIEFLGPELSAAHAVWLTQHDIDLFAEHGVGISHNPTSNLRLKSGQAPVHAMHEAGVYVAIGMDEAGFNDDCDILTEMRLAAVLSHDPGVDEPQLTSAQVLHMATQNGARITMFGDRIGALATGKRADTILIDLDRITTPYLDPTVDIVDALIYRARGVDVDTTIVDGQVLMRDGALTTIDKPDVLNQLADALNQPRSEAEQEWADIVQEVTPYVHAFFADWELETGEPFSIRNRKA
jgi:cytosine/adenosine deaminase-related metal-dependent hydrolase